MPARVSHSRGRYPLREFTRSSLRCPYGAPQIASASALISASANVFTIARSRSGLADSTCSRRKPAGSTLFGAVIALVSFDLDLAVSKDLRDDRLLLHDTPSTRPAVHHLRGRSLPPARPSRDVVTETRIYQGCRAPPTWTQPRSRRRHAAWYHIDTPSRLPAAPSQSLCPEMLLGQGVHRRASPSDQPDASSGVRHSGRDQLR